jgi:hypothetical protein
MYGAEEGVGVDKEIKSAERSAKREDGISKIVE